MDFLRVYWRTIRHLNLRGYHYIWANLLWVALSLPLVTAPAAWAGLIRLSHAAHTRPDPSLEDFWQGFRQHFWRGLAVAGLSLLVVVINLTNLYAYQAADSLLVGMMRVIWLGALVLWFSLLLYLWPLLEEMEQPSLLGGLRNSLVMVLHNPLFTLGMWPFIGLVIVVSFILPPMWLLLTGSIIAALSTTAVLNRLRAAGHHNPEHYVPVEERAGGV